ncbi:unnamed protein product, partial [Ceratitis capitata]
MHDNDDVDVDRCAGIGCGVDDIVECCATDVPTRKCALVTSCFFEAELSLQPVNLTIVRTTVISCTKKTHPERRSHMKE